jgi:hypothetical protein
MHYEKDLLRKVGRLSYKYDFMTADRAVDRLSGSDQQVANDWLVIDPYPNSEGEAPVGNATMFINDFRGLSGVRANCFFVEVLRSGWPHCFIVTSDVIEADEELLLDYTEGYWDTMTPLLDLIGLPVLSGPLGTAAAAGGVVE